MTLRERQVTAADLQVGAIVSRLAGRAALDEVCRYLRAEFPHFRWVGVYRVEGDRLVLAGWDGDAPTEHSEIPVGQGVCGRAARENRTVIVADVRNDPDYLECFVSTRSEIVVPVRDGATVLGEVDVDGDQVGAYDATDGRFLERIARRLVAPLRQTAGAPPVR